MDIAKIRKRLREAKEAKAAKKAEEPPVEATLGGDQPQEPAGPLAAGQSKETLLEEKLLPETLPEITVEQETRVEPSIDESLMEHIESPSEAVELEDLPDYITEETESPPAPIIQDRPEKPESSSIGPIEPPPPAMESPPAAVSPLPDEEAAEEIVELLTFRLAKEDYAFRVSDVEEILRPQRHASVPKTEDFIMGVTSLRGKIIPLVDLKKRVNLTGGTEDGKPKILILKGPEGSIGALVDRVIDVIRIPSVEIVEPPSHLSEAEAKFIEGVAISEGRFVSVMRLSEVMNFNVSL